MGVALAATLSLALPGLGCASTGDSEDAQGPEGGSGSARGARGPSAGLEGMVVDDSRCVSAGKRVAQVDLNQDDFADLITVYNAVDGVERVSCKQVDHNFDGRLDAFYYFDASGNIDREQYDLDFDGRIDVGRYFENDVVTRDEQDLDLDGAVGLRLDEVLEDQRALVVLVVGRADVTDLDRGVGRLGGQPEAERRREAEAAGEDDDDAIDILLRGLAFGLPTESKVHVVSEPSAEAAPLLTATSKTFSSTMSDAGSSPGRARCTGARSTRHHPCSPETMPG